MPEPSAIPVNTPFERQVENSTYQLIYTPPEQADAFWLPAEAQDAITLWEKLSENDRHPSGRIWFSASEAGAGQRFFSEAFDKAPGGQNPLLHAGISGAPVLRITKKEARPIYLSGLLQDSIELCEGIGLPVERPLGVSIKTGKAALEYGTHHKNGRPESYDEAEIKTLHAFGFMFRKPEHIPRDDAHIRAVCEHISRFPAGGGIYAWLFGQITSPNLQIQPEPETLIEDTAELRIFLPRRYADAADTLRF